MSKMIFYGIMIYFLYKLIFNVVVPVSKGVRTVRQTMEQARDAAAKQQANANTRSNSTFNNNPKPASPPIEAEYIDFEEVKKK
jgi:hypothetical protein